MDDRAEQAIDWAIAKLGRERIAIEPIGSDASPRRYFRLSETADSWIVMDSPPNQVPVAAFVHIQSRLQEAGLHVPEIFAADEEHGFLLLSDLGRTTYLEALNKDNAIALFEDAEQALLCMQRNTSTEGMPKYDAASLFAELNLIMEWFLPHHWQVEPTDEELDIWDSVCATLVRWALDQPQVFCHRDFMPRNLMVSTPNPGILDFQDALIGPMAYDITCLYMDAFVSWPRDDVDQWLEAYRQKAAQHGLPVPEDSRLWLRMCDLMSAQRHLKVIGIFARIAYRDNKPKYLQDVPRFFAYLEKTIARNPELEPLRALWKAWASRRVPTGDGSVA